MRTDRIDFKLKQQQLSFLPFIQFKNPSNLFIISCNLVKYSDILYQQTQNQTQMSHKIIERSNCSHSPYLRQKSPVYLSPKTKSKQPEIHFNHHPQFHNQFCISGESTHRQPQPLPLQFSSNRKIKSRPPPPYNSITNSIHQPYHYPQNNNNPNQQNINGRLHNQNGSFDSLDMSFGDYHKLKNYYENQMKNLLQRYKNLQADYQMKCVNLDREKNYWKQSFVIIKDEFQSHKRDVEAQKTGKVYDNQTNRLPSGKNIHFEEIIRSLQLQVDKHENYVKITENQIYNLNKQKAKLTYELENFKKQTKKINTQIFQLQYTLQLERRQIKQLKQKLRKEEEDSPFIKNLDIKSSKLRDMTLSFDSSSCQQAQTSQRSNSNSKSRSSSTSGSISGSSASSSRHKSKHRSTSLGHRQIPQEGSQPAAPNFDPNKQIQRFRHICRKLQKTLTNQNTQIISQGLKNLNNKYRKQYEQEEQQQKKLTEININIDQNKRAKQVVNFKFPISTQSKGKITSIKFI